MSATLNFNPIKYYSWKGKTFSQITTNIQKNIGTISINTEVRSQQSNQNLFKCLFISLIKYLLSKQYTYISSVCI